MQNRNLYLSEDQLFLKYYNFKELLNLGKIWVADIFNNSNYFIHIPYKRLNSVIDIICHDCINDRKKVLEELFADLKIENEFTIKINSGLRNQSLAITLETLADFFNIALKNAQALEIIIHNAAKEIANIFLEECRQRNCLEICSLDPLISDTCCHLRAIVIASMPEIRDIMTQISTGQKVECLDYIKIFIGKCLMIKSNIVWEKIRNYTMRDICEYTQKKLHPLLRQRLGAIKITNNFSSYVNGVIKKDVASYSLNRLEKIVYCYKDKTKGRLLNILAVCLKNRLQIFYNKIPIEVMPFYSAMLALIEIAKIELIPILFKVTKQTVVERIVGSEEYYYFRYDYHKISGKFEGKGFNLDNLKENTEDYTIIVINSISLNITEDKDDYGVMMHRFDKNNFIDCFLKQIDLEKHLLAISAIHCEIIPETYAGYENFRKPIESFLLGSYKDYDRNIIDNDLNNCKINSMLICNNDNAEFKILEDISPLTKSVPWTVRHLYADSYKNFILKYHNNKNIQP